MTYLMPILYKRTSKGAVQIWRTELNQESYRSISGQEDGALVTSAWTLCSGKNIGRSNETSAIEQAKLECDAAYTKKLAQGGYHELKEDIDSPKFFKPMLAKQYEDYPIKNWVEVYSQPKLDGIRCITNINGLWTREGKTIDSCPHVHDALRPLFEQDPDLIFDGELYADKLSQDFNKIISLVRKKNPDVERLAEAAKVIQYHIYDLPSHNGKYNERATYLFALLLKVSKPSPLIAVKTSFPKNINELDSLNAEYLNQGYEGQIIRLNGPYKNGRSKDLLKRKEFIDEEFEIVSINEGEGNRSGMAGYISYKMKNGKTFDSGIKGSFAYATELLKDADKYIGGQGTVRYFNLTPAGIPRFPITVAVYSEEKDL